MMYIEHFVLLAGAYNLGFFYCFGVRKKYFFDFSNCGKCTRTRTIFCVCMKTRNKKNIFYKYTKMRNIFLFYKYKNEKQIFMCIETRNSKNYTPGLQIQIRIPPSSLSRHKLVHLQQVAGIIPN